MELRERFADLLIIECLEPSRSFRAVAPPIGGDGLSAEHLDQPGCGEAKPYICDVGDTTEVERTFGQIASDLGPVDALIYNAGKGVWGSAEEVSLESFETAWRTNTLGAFVAAKCVIPAMKQRGSGQIILIGATASLRGGANTAAFASAKAAQRSLAQSLARSLWPAGIHVSLVIVDGIVDEPLMRAKLADRPDDFFVKPEDIADTLVQLTWQRRSAWSFEVEARPFGEKWSGSRINHRGVSHDVAIPQPPFFTGCESGAASEWQPRCLRQA